MIYSNYPSSPNEQDLSRELTHFKNLNRKLVSENFDLHEQLDLWESKHKIDSIFLNDQSINDKKKQNLIEKWGKNYWMKRINRHLSQTKRLHQEEMDKLNISYAIQIEDLNEVVSNLSKQLVSIEWLRKDHGEKFIRTVDRLSKKYKECKTLLKHSKAKTEKLESNLTKVHKELNEVSYFILFYRL